MADYKTEQPTQRRLDRARREGRFPTSREFVSAVGFTVFVALVVSHAGEAMAASRWLLRGSIHLAFRPALDPQAVAAPVFTLLASLAAAGGLVAAAMMGAQMVVTRFGLSTARLKPDFTRLNPVERLRRLPSQNLPQAAHALILLPLVGLAAWWVAEENAPQLARLPLSGLETGLATVAGSIQQVLWRGTALLLAVGCVEWWRERRRFFQQMRMSKQEIRDEHKEVEGNPMMKLRIRRLMRELARRRMMTDVEKATAVVVNPTHFAVALRWAPGQRGAPRVVAKGKNYLAARIRERALTAQVPIIENPPLAQALYTSTQVGQEIPPHLYRAVAEVLAYIWRLMNGRLPGVA